ncbi:MAG: threonine synthase, partial [Gammaproteobacteria bacterium]|nr:threonine synthase [Gammaproteobacteria bacterium]
MKYLSTGGGHETDLVGAIMQGLAPDGRLYVPEALPQFDPAAVEVDSIPEIAATLLEPFFDDSALAPSLGEICRDALNFPIPLRALESRDGPVAVLELFHGPTAAFKDVGARFLAASMERALPELDASDTRPLTILVATSGDTGGAVAAAFHGRPGFRVGVLFPKGQVSPRQQHQLTCWGGNIRSFEVDGSFDDCQALVKGAFGDPVISATHRLGAANSINVGRLLPQVVYHAAASLWYWREHGVTPNFIVPTGNLGNAMACIWARAIGMPIGQIILATNANRTIPDYLATGDWQPRASIQTLASAMDVGDPSNMERLAHLYPAFADLRDRVEACPVDDDAIRGQIARDYERHGDIWCPHTATGFRAYDALPAASKRDAWIVAATAHPAKFDNIVE